MRCRGEHARRLHGRLLSMADRHRSIDVALRVWRRDAEVDGMLVAAALAFRIFIWLLPCGLLLTALLGLTASGGRSLAELTRRIGMSPLITNVIGQIGAQAEHGWYVTALIGLVPMGVAGIKLGHALDGIHARVRRTAADRRLWPALARAARYNTAVLGIVVGNLVAPGVGAAVGQPILVIVVSSLALYFGSGAVLLTVEWPPRWCRILPGAALIALGIEGLHLVSVLYLPGQLASASQVFGTLGAAAAILVWLALIARLVVLGQVLNAVLAERGPRSRRAN
ncbi:YhjD/YihY/BrkB family envelope integrity protein [Amycolatopsis balhimycina]|nr:YhjD/YihY/BrkB family envelope integrity protein [Amycolatopsis balhimycina]